ncbi:MAG: TolC family protein [Cyanobacteria bacterium K_DeepCast_35m_m2_023]|nr:TolC family protein [Cyanobacteria bacterium K_DeepCast_35m_m2_023]
MPAPDVTAKTLALVLCAACLGSWSAAGAQNQLSQRYRINGQLGPQVQANHAASQLRAQLSRLKTDLETRSRATSLQQAIEAALLNNPDLASAYAQIQGSQWNLIAVRRQWYPTLNASPSGNALLGQSFSTSNPSGQVVNTPNYTNITSSGVAVTLGWTFFDPSRGPAINAANESLRQQQLLFDVSARNLVLAVQQTYFQLQEYRQLISAYDEILANTDRQVNVVEASFNSGLVSIAEVEQIRTQQYSTLSTVISTYRQLLDTAAQLAQTMALPPGALVLLADQLRTMGSWSEPLPKTIDQALRLREEIQASLAAAASASWSASSLFNSYWPQFSLGASGSVANTNTTSGLPGISTTSTTTNLNWNGGVGLGFSWQFFDGGINAASGQASRSRAVQLQNQAASQRLNVTREVEQAYNAYLTSQLGLQSTTAQVQAVRQAVIAVEQRFKVGVESMTAVVQTLERAIAAANAYATAVRTYNTAVANLYRSSARWPEGTQTLLHQRTTALKQQ